MKLNKEKFLKSELGGNLQECVTAWDHWLTELRKFNIDTVGQKYRETRKAADWCQAQWEVFQTVMRQFYNIEYHFSRTDEYFGVCTEDETDWLFKVEREVLEQFIYSTYTIVLPIIVTALMGYVVWLLKNQKKDRDANSKGTMLLLRVQLIEYHDKYMRLGDIPSYAYENFMEMYDAYHALGGNGMITKMMHEIEELHLKKKEV